MRTNAQKTDDGIAIEIVFRDQQLLSDGVDLSVERAARWLSNYLTNYVQREVPDAANAHLRQLAPETIRLQRVLAAEALDHLNAGRVEDAQQTLQLLIERKFR